MKEVAYQQVYFFASFSYIYVLNLNFQEWPYGDPNGSKTSTATAP